MRMVEILIDNFYVGFGGHVNFISADSWYFNGY